jgi:hypothetical protein
MGSQIKQGLSLRDACGCGVQSESKPGKRYGSGVKRSSGYCRSAESQGADGGIVRRSRPQCRQVTAHDLEMKCGEPISGKLEES